MMPSDQWKPLRWKDIDAEQIKIVSAVIDKIPELPVHVHKILKIVSDIDSDAKEIAQLASSDPVMVTKILNVVNSSYYGFSKKIEDVHLAIVLLGFAEIRTLALQTMLTQSIGKGNVYAGYDTRNLWLHSYQVSVCSEAFVGEKNPKMSGIYLALGLLHDIGKFLLCNIAFAMKQKRIKPKSVTTLNQDAAILEREEHLFGVNHSIMGVMLARKWGLSDRIASVIEYHHYPSYFDLNEIPCEYLEDITSICIADHIINYLENKSSMHPIPPESFFNLLGFTLPVENVITVDIRKKIEKAKSFLTYIE
ncbi:MAG: HDOD domain-containing protein [Candidatus Latescibacteria bacterium]|nr:HDOD domain-containing protein [Candidatus Latescibacterota bacterium]